MSTTAGRGQAAMTAFTGKCPTTGDGSDKREYRESGSQEEK